METPSDFQVRHGCTGCPPSSAAMPLHPPRQLPCQRLPVRTRMMSCEAAFFPFLDNPLLPLVLVSTSSWYFGCVRLCCSSSCCCFDSNGKLQHTALPRQSTHSTSVSSRHCCCCGFLLLVKSNGIIQQHTALPAADHHPLLFLLVVRYCCTTSAMTYASSSSGQRDPLDVFRDESTTTFSEQSSEALKKKKRAFWHPFHANHLVLVSDKLSQAPREPNNTLLCDYRTTSTESPVSSFEPYDGEPPTDLLTKSIARASHQHTAVNRSIHLS